MTTLESDVLDGHSNADTEPRVNPQEQNMEQFDRNNMHSSDSPSDRTETTLPAKRTIMDNQKSGRRILSPHKKRSGDEYEVKSKRPKRIT